MAREPFSFQTKARTLETLRSRVTLFQVPDLVYFAVGEWSKDPAARCADVAERLGGLEVIVRSSAADEDGAHWAMAGQFASVPHVPAGDATALAAAVDEVVRSYARHGASGRSEDEVIVQRMVCDPVMSGVLFTQDLNTGAPYYVINYDDESGRTDTVTSGSSEYANRTLYVHRGAVHAVKSPRFRALLAAVRELEEITGHGSLDVEFALDAELTPYLLQVRLITTHSNWNRAITHRIDTALEGVHRLVESRLRRLPGVRGRVSVLGQMPDWNPAEMIGRAPRRLASSLYRHLITDTAWRDAREEMGYAVPAGHPLMMLLAGQPYIDARLSFHSYLPASLPVEVGEKLVDAWLARLRENPHLHDKVEFDVAITTHPFDFDAEAQRLIPGVLSDGELLTFKHALRDLTAELVRGPSLASAMARIGTLERRHGERDLDPTPTAIAVMLEECVRLGTIPFSVLARHGFVARSLLLSLVRLGVFSPDEASAFSRSIRTVASGIVTDLRRMVAGELDGEAFMGRYGHLRPGTYDILSPRYDQAPHLWEGIHGGAEADDHVAFDVSPAQLEEIGSLLDTAGMEGITARSLMTYVREATAGREYGKFVFTRTLSDALELVADFGEGVGLSREEIAHVPIGEILRVGVESEAAEPEERLRVLAEAGAEAHAVTVAIRLPQLLFDLEGVHVVPFQISHPNFITHRTVRAHCVLLRSDVGEVPDLSGKVVMIENADPGFDWIFAHEIAGLVTKYGGANSHMAIRCAEFGIPAAIGCGEQLFERLVVAGGIEMDCGGGHARPMRLQ